MARDIVAHPETGQPVVKTVVESYEPIELEQVRSDVAVHEATVNSLSIQLNEAQAALEDSKSDLERIEAVVAQSPAGADEGSEGASGEAEDTVAEPETDVQF